ncbi:FAD-dependent oxidoreductase [Anaerotruncus rubiinfantis]|uniref:FAD-dependent oxidoreductase n=1 Tax=Anaerotruncus rubiinfantis TaxID=1720200 RepID=UPI000834FC40|nr:FAD-binding protein [Anaerotruncus rubiinfantis]
MQENTKIAISGVEIPVHFYNTIVIGSGAAAFNAADSLYDFGQKDVAIVTEGVNMGTSRNTGSDKQTYYKLSLASGTPDSVYDMAKVLYGGQSVHGDTALVEAALSARCFYKLVNLGVPFPHDRYGQYVGYKTDHDPSQRATSCGPLTSRYMTEHLERSVRQKGIAVFDALRIVSLLTREENGETSVVGALAINKRSPSAKEGLTLFGCTNVVYATGGPSGLYYRSVFPQSQTCAHGAAFLCGAKGSNVGEWQYGIASTDFRWNLSGTYQQVIPRYLSTAPDGSDAREFLLDYFEDPQAMLNAVFLKGYQWPFDPRKVQKGGSSLVDIAVYHEINRKGRRVFLDFTKNPSCAGKDGTFDFSLLSQEAYQYLEKSGVLFGTPIERLLAMNRPAYQLYADHGIDLTRDLLEIAVCAQHNNGGLQADMWWQSNVKHLFPVGEACGNFGVYRPGGSALNAGQVGSLRAAQYIAARAAEPPLSPEALQAAAEVEVSRILSFCDELAKPGEEKLPPKQVREKYQREMDVCAAFLRRSQEIEQQIERCRGYLRDFTRQTLADSTGRVVDALINRDILVTQIVYLSGMKAYISDGGGSRGSYLVDRGDISYDDCRANGVASVLDDGRHAGSVQEVTLEPDGRVVVENIPRRPLPEDNCWFEVTYNDYLNDRVVGAKG